MRIALLSCVDLPEPDFDEAPLCGAILAAGASPETVPWDDVDPAALAAFDIAVIRATWNYAQELVAFEGFLQAARRVTRVVNPLEAFEQNHHKRYLLDLAARGVPTVPTVLVRQGKAVPELSEGPRVVKPAVGAGSWEVYRCATAEEAAARAVAGAAVRDTLIQPLVPGFANPGERALVWIAGAFTHGVRKEPRYHGDDEAVHPLERLDRADLEVAERAVATLPAGCLYARVDLVDHEGQPVVSEIEAIEPSLFFAAYPPAAGRLAEALIAR